MSARRYCPQCGALVLIGRQSTDKRSKTAGRDGFCSSGDSIGNCREKLRRFDARTGKRLDGTPSLVAGGGWSQTRDIL